jgi:condensin complex subunit 2
MQKLPSAQTTYTQFNEPLEKFTSTIEMVCSNKVSKSNAFENRILDMIGDVFARLQTTTEESETIWQRYSTGIDSCAKIYGFCVDNLHSETFKILGGLSRTGNPNLVENNEGDLETQLKKHKKKVNGGVKTLETDIQAITTTQFDRFEYFDPYFKAVSSKFDVSTTSGLLLNNISLGGNLNLMLSNEDNIKNTEKIDTTSQIYLLLPNLSLESLQKESLCEKIVQFDQNINQNNIDLVNLLQNMEIDNEIYNNSDSEVSDQQEILEEILENPDFNSRDKENISLHESSTTLYEKISNLVEMDDYNFFSNSKISNWAGFEYWKKAQTPRVQADKLPKKQKEYTDITIDPLLKTDLTSIIPPRKSYSNYVSDTTLKKWEENNSKVPEDYGFSLFRLTQLFSRPRTQVKHNKTTTKELKSVIVDQKAVLSVEDDQALFAEEVHENISPGYEENLKIASVSKTVDIKKLKDTIWNKISADTKKENFCGPAKATNFISIVDSLPDYLPDQEIQNLSIHSCFITMLHLANEHGLLLTSKGECDFTITHPN